MAKVPIQVCIQLFWGMSNLFGPTSLILAIAALQPAKNDHLVGITQLCQLVFGAASRGASSTCSTAQQGKTVGTDMIQSARLKLVKFAGV